MVSRSDSLLKTNEGPAPIPPRQHEVYEIQVNALRDLLQEEKFKSAWQEGRGMSLDQAVEFVLKGHKGSGMEI